VLFCGTIASMALTPQEKKEAHERGLRAKAEREVREERSKPEASIYGPDYARFRRVGLTHEEALEEIEKRRIAAERFEKERPLSGTSGGVTRIGPRGGRYTEAQAKDGQPYRRYF
jgi:hypothetical protein